VEPNHEVDEAANAQLKKELEELHETSTAQARVVKSLAKRLERVSDSSSVQLTEDALVKSSAFASVMEQASSLVEELSTRDDFSAKFSDLQSKYHLLLKDKQTFESQLKSDWNDSRSQITAMKNSNSMLIAENARLQ